MSNMRKLDQQSAHGRLTPIADPDRSLDSTQLHDLEEAFRRWAGSSDRPSLQGSRKRILLIFLIIRYAGARLNEVLHLDPEKDFRPETHTICFCKNQDTEPSCREVQVPEAMFVDIQDLCFDLQPKWPGEAMFRIDPAHVRKKFYERATSIGIPQAMGSPDVIRKSRAVELIHSNMPLPVVQRILGHSTPNLTASYVEFSDAEISNVAGYFAQRESNRKTSARNSFFGKISTIEKGDIQSLVEVLSASGNGITAIITTNSLQRIGLKPGMFITAEIKAPGVQLCKSNNAPACSAENVFQGTVCRIANNHTTAEVVVRLPDSTELCAIITERRHREMGISNGDTLWVFFDAFSVVLHID